MLTLQMKLNDVSKATQLSLHNSGGNPRVIIVNESDPPNPVEVSSLLGEKVRSNV